MIAFCNHVNSGSDERSRNELFCLHVDDAKKKTGGVPKLPAEYQPYLLKSPIEAEVTRVGKAATVKRDELWPPGKYNITEVELNRGKAAGLLPGMGLYRDAFPDVRVLEVAANSCRARLWNTSATKRLKIRIAGRSADTIGASLLDTIASV